MQLKDLELADIEGFTGIDRPRLSRIFAGDSISEKTIKRFAIALNVSPSEAFRQIEEIRAEKRAKRRI